MKNLLSYKGDALQEYKDAILRKTGDKSVFNNIETDIELAYGIYKQNFDSNTLHNIAVDNKFHICKNDLLSLYDYQNRIVRNIRENINNQQLETIRNTCQNCTIDSVGTMDHFLPKTDYPEYAVNAYNLFPCCSKCNEYKSRTTGNHKFLNLFLDKLPDIQYLFIDIIKDNDTLNFKFYLTNSQSKIDSLLFQKIEKHFDNLHLLQRMRDCSISYLSDFISSIRPHYCRNGKDYVIETVLEDIDELRKGYGFNYWKSSLKAGLIYSSYFWDYISNL
jgi:5-methylcytosine-specific restriction endonuclease McrA